MAQYLILIYERRGRVRRRVAGGHQRGDGGSQPLRRAVRRAGNRSAATRCSRRQTATSIRNDVVTDGPFVETKEVLGGYYLIEADDLDQALAIAKLLPGPVRRRRGATDHGLRVGNS